MIKKTLCFSNPAYLSLTNKQLVIKLPEVEQNNSLPDTFKQDATRTIPIEDIGVVLLDNKQITVTQGTIEALLDNNCAIISCNSNHLPVGLMLPLEGHTLQSERFKHQIEASLPLKKQLWQQTIQAKISNQATALHRLYHCEVGNMRAWARDVRSGDPDNYEARAAAYYWQSFFTQYPTFVRGREGDPPNNLLNYGYAILRAVVARSLVGSGLLPTLGIHHHNRYNAYCLADDIMEPYRPYIDCLVADIVNEGNDISQLTTAIKARLLTIPILDVVIEGRRSPLMIATTRTTASLAACFMGETRKIAYPTL